VPGVFFDLASKIRLIYLLRGFVGSVGLNLMIVF
jgi:hypothetical protein